MIGLFGAKGNVGPPHKLFGGGGGGAAPPPSSYAYGLVDERHTYSLYFVDVVGVNLKLGLLV